MFRTITLTLAALFAFNAQAADVTQDTYLLNLSELYEDDAAYLAKVLDCTPEKDGTCSVEVWGEAVGLGSGQEEWHDPKSGLGGYWHDALFVEEFEVNKDGSLMLWGIDDDGREAEVTLVESYEDVFVWWGSQGQ